MRDALLVFLDRRVLPEVVVLVLHPKGYFRPPRELALRSPKGWTTLEVRWRVVELWTLPAEELLATNDPGLMPWVPLADIQGSPEPVLQQCRAIIERFGAAEERSSLLAVAQVLASLRYNEPGLLSLLGGREAMIESPVIQEIVAETRAEAEVETKAAAILAFLRARFGTVPADVASVVASVRDGAELDRLIDLAAQCPDLAAFRAKAHS